MKNEWESTSCIDHAAILSLYDIKVLALIPDLSLSEYMIDYYSVNEIDMIRSVLNFQSTFEIVIRINNERYSLVSNKNSRI
ncbi:unnamed protein product [Blepharisma stoltei]|uniref:Maturase n=1 Tax=Blepharisma stoltei TaxID=1481888 RepID=A0AAU9IY58_9CILI|nr:unnamed protein product [Blepharisma stoltei]